MTCKHVYRRVKGLVQRLRIGSRGKTIEKEPWEEEYEQLVTNEGLFEEYLEMGELLTIKLEN